MGEIVKNRLFKYVDKHYYDLQGYVDHNKLQDRLGIKAVKMAGAMGITQRALQKNPYSEKTQYRLRKIVYILTLLKEMLNTDQEIAIWLRAPNPDYDGLSPLEVITQGKMDSLVGYLTDIQKGALT